MVWGPTQFNLSQPVGDTGGQLANGAVARGVVTSTSGGETTAQVAGKTITLPTHPQLPVGATFLLRNQDGQWQVVPLPSASSASNVSSAVPRELMTQAGLPANGPVALLAQSLLIADIPVTAAWLEGLTQALGTISPQDTNALVFMLQRGIPISHAALQEVYQLLNTRDNLGEVLFGLVQWGQSLPAGSSPPLVELTSQLEQFFLMLSGSSASLSSQQVGQSILNGGSGLEHALFLLAASSTTSQLAQTALGDLRTLLARLNHELSNLPANEHQTARQLVQRAQNLTEAIQLQNLPPSNPPPQGAWQYFQLPIMLQSHPSVVELAYRQHSQQKKNSRRPGSELMLQVRLPDWGPVRVFLLTQDHQITVALTIATATIRDLLMEHSQELAEALAGIGYPHPEIRCVIRNLEDEQLWNIVAPSSSTPPVSHSVDLKI